MTMKWTGLQFSPFRIGNPVCWQEDKTFLPAALEILETPPSPVRAGILLAICTFFAAALVWSWFGTIDIYATASGKIVPTGQVKTVQPIMIGRVQAIRVTNGAHVNAGDTLVELDAAEAESQEKAIELALASYQAEVIRRSYEIDLARKAAVGLTDSSALGLVAKSPDWPNSIPSDIRDRESRILRDEIAQLDAALASLNAQEARMEKERDGLAATIQTQNLLVETIRTRVGIHSELVERQAESKASLIDATEVLQAQQAKLSEYRSQFDEAAAGIPVMRAELAKTVEAFVSDGAQKLSDAARRAADLEPQLQKARVQLAAMTLKSSVSGTVQSLDVTTIGQVVTTGQELMRIVPDGSELEIGAFLDNRDKGFVHEGAKAQIKIDAFPYVRYGTISGTVTRVAGDSVPAAEALRSEADPASAIVQSGAFGAARQTQNLVYAVSLHPEKTSIWADGIDQPLSPGMSVTVDIRTGERRILEYLFSPLVEVSSGAMRER
jgi:hemolysin D